MTTLRRGIPLLSMTPSAVRRLAEMRALGIPRVQVAKGGCAGMTWSMEQVEIPLPGDMMVEYMGAELLVSMQSSLWLTGCTVDWVEENFEEGFRFIGANETSRCGCGKSFLPPASQTAKASGQVQ